MKHQEILNQLAHCSGSEEIYKHPNFDGINYTSGVREVAILCQAYWLIQEIMIEGFKLQETEGFITSELFKNKDESSCYILYTDGNNNELSRKEIPFTDFPLFNTKELENGKEVLKPAMTIWLVNKIMLLPSEY